MSAAREGRIDVLTDFELNRHSFDVDLSGLFNVNIAPPAAAPGHYLAIQNGKYMFPVGENILIQNVHIALPYCFSRGTAHGELVLQWKNAANTVTIPFQSMSQNGGICLREFDNPIGLNIYEPFPDASLFPGGASEPMKITPILSGNVNMSNNPPVDFDTETLYVQIYLQILHTNQLP